MAKKQIAYAEAMTRIDEILERLRNEEMDVDRLAAEVKPGRSTADAGRSPRRAETATKKRRRGTAAARPSRRPSRPPETDEPNWQQSL